MDAVCSVAQTGLISDCQSIHILVTDADELHKHASKLSLGLFIVNVAIVILLTACQQCLPSWSLIGFLGCFAQDLP